MMGASERYCELWQGETDSAHTYHALAELEEETSPAELYRRLAVTEERHAEAWAAKLKHAGKTPTGGTSRRERILVWLAPRVGPQRMSSLIELSRATMRNIRQNLVIAFGYNALGIPIAAVSFITQLSPMITPAAIVASSLSVVTKANRLRHWRAPVG